ncbi:MAG: hypothetical protein COB53_12345, partial [Elusimicrobia bacterium]
MLKKQGEKRIYFKWLRKTHPTGKLLGTMGDNNTKGHILIADDDEEWAGVCQVAVKQLGYTSEMVHSRKAAIELVDKGPFFDYALVDLNFPDEADGGATIYAIKKRSPETDAILMTATPTLGTAIEILKEGASDYIIKPFSEDYLATVLERCRVARTAKSELDVSNRLREELNAAYMELQETEQLKDAFLSRVSHELNTPLTYVTMALGLLQEQVNQNKDTDYDRNLARAREGVEGLHKTINDLLAFVDLQKPGLEFVKRTFNISVLLDNVIEKQKRLAKAKELPLTLKAEANLQVEGDALLLERAFAQLIQNAINFNQEDGSVDVEVDERGDWISVRIIDRG